MPGTITPIGVGTAPRFTRQTTAGPQLTNMLADPGMASTPVIFEPSPGLTAGLPEVWVIATGGQAILMVPGVSSGTSFIGRFQLERFKGVSFRPDGSSTRSRFDAGVIGSSYTGLEQVSIEGNTSFSGGFTTERFRGVSFRPDASIRPRFYEGGSTQYAINQIDFQLASLPPSIAVGDYVEDLTNPDAIPTGTTVTTITGGVVTFSNPITVSVGDQIVFYTENWGGCQVWISLEGDTYAFAGTIYAGGRTGTLTADLPNHTDPDTASTLSIDLTRSAGQLLSATAAERDAFATLCYCGGELISYETATLTGTFNYDVTSLRRGVYGSVISTHTAGELFARFGPTDPSLFRYRYPTNYVGQEISIKLLSYNSYGQKLQSLSDVSAFTYILTGAGSVTPNVVPFQFVGTPVSGTPIVLFTFGESVSFPVNFAGSPCGAGVMATASTTFNLAKNGGAPFGTMNFAAGSTVATFLSSAESFASGDLLSITPTSTDATLANISGVLVGSTP